MEIKDIKARLSIEHVLNHYNIRQTGIIKPVAHSMKRKHRALPFTQKQTLSIALVVINQAIR